jgi:hypothetical protein
VISRADTPYRVSTLLEDVDDCRLPEPEAARVPKAPGRLGATPGGHDHDMPFTPDIEADPGVAGAGPWTVSVTVG